MPCLSALIKGGDPTSVFPVVPLFDILEVTIGRFWKGDRDFLS